mmetsp:Transcript_16171/g.56483  ORF Transcript_16171/g.56483 Transcript_16171/m.56483 type:complete len:203 (-) Transcript_16171:2145-2753(-)
MHLHGPLNDDAARRMLSAHECRQCLPNLATKTLHGSGLRILGLDRTCGRSARHQDQLDEEPRLARHGGLRTRALLAVTEELQSLARRDRPAGDDADPNLAQQLLHGGRAEWRRRRRWPHGPLHLLLRQLRPSPLEGATVHLCTQLHAEWLRSRGGGRGRHRQSSAQQVVHAEQVGCRGRGRGRGGRRGRGVETIQKVCRSND